MDYNRDFIDQTHLNGNGAEKLTKYLGAYMESAYSLNDYRGEAAYEQWEQSYVHYLRNLQASKLLEITESQAYITQLAQMEDFLCVISFEGKYKESTLDLRGYAKLLGLTDEQFETGGTFLIAEGKVEQLLDNESKETVIYELNQHDALKIQNMTWVNGKEGGLDDVMLNMESVGSTFAGVNVIVYDTMEQKLIDKRGFY